MSGSVALSALAQVLLKIGTATAGTELSVAGWYQAAIASPWTMAGLATYAFSALLWLRMLGELTPSQACPLVALGVLISSLSGVWLLGEPLMLSRTVGAALIAAGVMLVGWR